MKSRTSSTKLSRIRLSRPSKAHSRHGKAKEMSSYWSTPAPQTDCCMSYGAQKAIDHNPDMPWGWSILVVVLSTGSQIVILSL